MKAEFILPPEFVEEIVEKLFQKLKPIMSNNEKHEGNDIFDIKELAEYLQVTTKWVYQQTHLKTIPHLKLTNKQLRFRKKDIDNWLNTLKIPPVGEPTGKMRLIR